jgi:hypothetical protein
VFSSLEAVALESVTQGDSLAKIDHHHFEGQKSELTIHSPGLRCLTL